jgi:magnesium transporter
MPISAVHFGRKVRHEESITAEQALKLVKDPHHVWIDVVRAEHEDLKEILKTVLPDYYKIVLENAMTEDTKPKVSVYDDFVYFTIKTYPSQHLTEEHHMSFVLGDDFLLTVREGHTDISDIKRYFLNSKNKTVDFAVYKILELVFVKYFKVLDEAEERLDYYEDHILQENGHSNLSHGHFKDILHLKRELLKFHKTLVATRDVMIMLSRGQLKPIKPKTAAYLREVYDDILQLIDVEETFREVMASVIEMHMSSINNQLNTVVKTLTILTAFMMAPTLIAGIYGMNFEYMPELHWKYGYAFALGLMGLSIAALYTFFKKKKWI